MDVQIICEPVDVSPERVLRADHVQQREGSEALLPFHHFHDVCELVWFRAGSGNVFSERGCFALKAGIALFLPAMQSHDFAIDAGVKDWIFVHIDPVLVTGLIKEEGLSPLNQALCCHFTEKQYERFDTLFCWIHELSRDDPTAKPTLTRLVKLVLLEICRAAQVEPKPGEHDISTFERLRPALNLVAENPSANLALTDAASACLLSPAYFSRRFKAVFGMNFSEYTHSYRLRIAARKLITTGERISDIAFGLGYATPAHFTAIFKKHFGLAPRAYRLAAQRHWSF